MELGQRIWVGAGTTALACALVVGTASAEHRRTTRTQESVGEAPSAARPKSKSKAKAKAKSNSKRRAKKARRGSKSRRDGRAATRRGSDEPLTTRLHSAWVFYSALSEWQLRSQLDPPSYEVARRALSLAVALASARPGGAIAAALTPEPPLLEQRPVGGRVISGYGVRRDPFRRKRRKKHNGVDLRAGRGVPVLAAGPGVVARAKRMRGYGRVVYVDHGSGVQTRYAHLQKIAVEEGDFVPPGALVGKVGSSGRATGPHLHFEVRANGRPVAPVEILGLLAANTPLAVWLERMMDGSAIDPAAGEIAKDDGSAVKKPKRSKSRRKKVRSRRRGMRSRRPTS